MSDNYHKLIELMKESDARRQRLDDLELESCGHRLALQRNALTSDPLWTELAADVPSYEAKTERIIQNEELIKLYFYRFVVSDATKSSDQPNACFWRSNSTTRRAVTRLLQTMATLDASDPFGDNRFDVKSGVQSLAKVVRNLHNKNLQSLATNDVLVYDCKQVLNKFGRKESGSDK